MKYYLHFFIILLVTKGYGAEIVDSQAQLPFDQGIRFFLALEGGRPDLLPGKSILTMESGVRAKSIQLGDKTLTVRLDTGHVIGISIPQPDWAVQVLYGKGQPRISFKSAETVLSRWRPVEILGIQNLCSFKY